MQRVGAPVPQADAEPKRGPSLGVTGLRRNASSALKANVFFTALRKVEGGSLDIFRAKQLPNFKQDPSCWLQLPKWGAWSTIPLRHRQDYSWRFGFRAGCFVRLGKVSQNQVLLFVTVNYSFDYVLIPILDWDHT